MRMVQLINSHKDRIIGVVDDEILKVVNKVQSIYHLAMQALDSHTKIKDCVDSLGFRDRLDYIKIYADQTEWNFLPSYDVPDFPERLLVSGTGLTHRASADNRQKMHALGAGSITDSMRMYLKGIEGGAPRPDSIGVQPEWFYKGNGSILRGHNDVLEVPVYAWDGGEEAEIASVYICDQTGTPFRIGFTPANEFSDHVMEKENYLYLAPSKIRHCALGPEILIDSDFENFSGKVEIFRNNDCLWKKKLKSGNVNMVHNLQNIEYHHFKYANHRLPFQGHVHFLGTGAFSFGEGIELAENDEMIIKWEGLGKPLINKIAIEGGDEMPIIIHDL